MVIRVSFLRDTRLKKLFVWSLNTIFVDAISESSTWASVTEMQIPVKERLSSDSMELCLLAVSGVSNNLAEISCLRYRENRLTC